MQNAIYVLNGPNLNRLGKREPEIYGRTTLAEIEAMCRKEAGDRPIAFHQTNAEGQMIDWIHEATDGGGAGIAVFLASRASDFVTGAAIPVDGGFSVQS